MSRRGRRIRQPRGPHKDKYGAEAAKAQEARAALDAEWARSHPTPPQTTATEVPNDTEEEVA